MLFRSFSAIVMDAVSFFTEIPIISIILPRAESHILSIATLTFKPSPVKLACLGELNLSYSPFSNYASFNRTTCENAMENQKIVDIVTVPIHQADL